MRPAHALASQHLAVALFGIAGLFGAWLALPPTAIVLGRTTIAAATLALVAAATNSWSRPTAGLALNGAVLAVHWVAFFAAIHPEDMILGKPGRR